MTVPISFRGNCGGSDLVWMNFLCELYDISFDEYSSACADLISPVTIQGKENFFLNVLDQNPAFLDSDSLYKKYYKSILTEKKEMEVNARRYWGFNSGNRKPFVTVINAFKGRFALFCDRKTASAAESIVPVLKMLGAEVIGENTMGIGSFANLILYLLPNSGIQISLPNQARLQLDGKSIILPGLGEMPDYWVTSPEEYDAIINDLMNSDK